jgi:hypothetical protein
MLSDSPKRLKKTWEQLTAAASMETDPEKLGTILEEILAALEESDNEPCPCHKMHLSQTGNSDNFAGASPFRAH